MAKPLRSPVVGYNHNVRYHGRIFHVQSEDSGPTIPRVFTHLFYEGTILVTRKHEYEISSDEDLVRLEMQKLHKAVMKELTRGDHDAKIAAFFTSRGLPAILPDAAAPAAEVVQTAPAVAAASPPLSQRPASPPIASTHVAASNGAPGAVVVQGSGMVGPGGAPGESRSPTRPGTRPQGIPRTAVPVVKPPELKRPPVVLSSSADGVVVQRNVVIGVGGPGGTPGPTRPARIRPPVPYVVREGSYVPASSGSSDGQPARTVAPPAMTPSPAPVAGKGGHAGITWDAPSVAAPSPGQPVAAIDRRGHTAPASDRSFGNELVSDKSLDEVILEYLSDDSDTDES